MMDKNRSTSVYMYTHIYIAGMSIVSFIFCYVYLFFGGGEREKGCPTKALAVFLFWTWREKMSEREKRALTSKNGHSSMPIGWAGSVVCYPTVLYTAQHHTHRYIINARRNMSSFEFLDEYVHLFFVLLSCRHSFVLFFEHFQVHWSCWYTGRLLFSDAWRSYKHRPAPMVFSVCLYTFDFFVGSGTGCLTRIVVYTSGYFCSSRVFAY